jgi:hypothetical protein
MNNLSLEQFKAWSRKPRHYRYGTDGNTISLFGFIDANWGYGRMGVGDDTKI